jgi:hypothetical protein
MKNNWWIFGTWQQKYLEKVENFSFHSVNLKKKCLKFWKFCQLSEPQNWILENLNSKPHMKCRGFQGLLLYDDNSNVTNVGNMDWVDLIEECKEK